MKTDHGIGQRLAAACVVAVGLAILWGLAIGWLASFARILLPAPDRASESLLITSDGTPVIATQTTELGNALTIGRRTLDGKPWPLDYENWLSGVYFFEPFQPPGLVNIPVSWARGGIVGGSDGKLPPTAWYFVADDDQHMYATGFDAFSKLPIGYIGRAGFGVSKPPLSEQFCVQSIASAELRRFVLSSQNLDYRSLVRYHELWDGDSPPQWYVYLLEEDQLWEIDLRQRTSRSVAQFNAGISIARTSVPQTTFDQLDSKPGAVVAEASTQATTDNAATATNDEAVPDDDAEQQKYAMLLAVREPQRITYFDLPATKQHDFQLPQQLADRRFTAYLLSADQLLIHAYEQGDEYWSGGPIVRLLWIDRQGTVAREQEVKLAGWVPDPPRRKAAHATALIPVPIVWLVGMALGAPLYALQMNFASNYTSALALVVGIAWPGLVVVLVLALLLSWFTLKLQRKYHRPASGTWSAFVFLFGAAGFVAYWLEHRGPKLETCPQCGHLVPRDRDACAACRVPFAAPQAVGTEIFA
jgi:hypothetical protein